MRVNPNRLTLLIENTDKSIEPAHKDHTWKSKNWCRKVHPNGSYCCTRPSGHEGWHETYHEPRKLVQSRWPPGASKYD